MENENEVVDESTFDTDSALEDISSGLGFGEGEAVAEEAPASAPEAESAPAPTAETPESAAEPAAQAAPKTWRPEAAAQWATLPPAIQAEVLKREEDIFRGLETYKADAGFGKSVKSVLDPYLPILAQHNIDPVQQVAGLMQAHYSLATGTAEQKTAMFAKLAADYGVQLQPPGEAPYIDPQVASLQQQLTSLQSTIQGREAKEAAQTRQTLTTEINTFAADPAHPHFDEVASDIAGLIKAGYAANLAEAYEKAVWANPVTRAKEQARLTTEALATAQKSAGDKLKAAKAAAAANVKSSSKPASGTATLGSIDDTLQSALANIKSRN